MVTKVAKIYELCGFDLVLYINSISCKSSKLGSEKAKWMLLCAKDTIHCQVLDALDYENEACWWTLLLAARTFQHIWIRECHSWICKWKGRCCFFIYRMLMEVTDRMTRNFLIRLGYYINSFLLDFVELFYIAKLFPDFNTIISWGSINAWCSAIKAGGLSILSWLWSEVDTTTVSSLRYDWTAIVIK